MGFGSLVLLELLLVLAAGLVIFGGVKGIFATSIILSAINYSAGYPDQFWRRENYLLLGVGCGLLVLFILTRQARRGSKIQGMAAGMASIVLLGAFVTPVMAIIIWALFVGTGLIRKGRKGEFAWGLAPAMWRLVMALAVILYGNIW